MASSDKIKKSFGLKNSLIVAVVACAALVAVLSFSTATALQKLEKQTEYFVETAVPELVAVGNIRTASQAIPRYMWLSLATPVQSPERSEALKQVQDYQVTLTDKVKNLIETTEDPEFKAKTVELQAQIDPLFTIVKQGVFLIQAGSDLQARSLLQGAMPFFDSKVSGLANELDVLFHKQNQSAAEAAKKLAATSTLQFRVVSALAALLIICSGLYLARSLTKQLTSFTTKLGETSNVLTFATNQLSISSAGMSDASVKQSAAIDKTATAVEEISSMVKQTAESTQIVMGLSESSKNEAVQGNSIVQQMIGAMDEIGKNSTELMRQVQDNNEKFNQVLVIIKDVAAKTKVIDDIVFQTKLLSFNASVEAARAGESGRGFSVVAEEVGKLAHMSGVASSEISNLVSESVRRAEDLLKETQDSVMSMVDNSQSKVMNGKSSRLHTFAKNTAMLD